ncbi:MAG: hypothetical protein HDS64_02005 [Bacteroidales bacterium]|nr:hypothetical protein [Bacteroidales bacterium]MBD5294306.1 hypothetical protein [Bacteroides sp.]MDE6262058.1 hypothetical protein [Muribaculaceae bacterium]MBD5351409.1 hypothetical protein [Bacteroides sp.]MBD5360133.1 hypothetical protein [Bacteroides sp.]
MKKLIFAFFISIFSLTSCAEKEATVDDAEIPQAAVRGQNDAQALLEIAGSDVKDIHSALLSVKAREWEMRRNGSDRSADAYINAFKEYVSTQNKTLADEIF